MKKTKKPAASVKPKKAVKRKQFKKVKDSFLEIGKRYQFNFDPASDYLGTLLSVNKSELLVKNEYGVETIINRTMITTIFTLEGGA
jgi:hypothetical protein